MNRKFMLTLTDEDSEVLLMEMIHVLDKEPPLNDIDDFLEYELLLLSEDIEAKEPTTREKLLGIHIREAIVEEIKKDIERRKSCLKVV